MWKWESHKFYQIFLSSSGRFKEMSSTAMAPENTCGKIDSKEQPI